MLLCGGETGQQRPQPNSTRTVEQAERDAWIGQESVLCHDDQVAQQGDGGTRPDRSAVDRRDAREREPVHRPEQLLVLVQNRVATSLVRAHLSDRLDVAACTE